MSVGPIRIDFAPLTPVLLTEAEAATYLRLVDNGDDVDAAKRRMNRLVDHGKIRPCLVGGKRRYAVRELDRFIADETEKYAEVPM